MRLRPRGILLHRHEILRHLHDHRRHVGQRRPLAAKRAPQVRRSCKEPLASHSFSFRFLHSTSVRPLAKRSAESSVLQIPILHPCHHTRKIQRRNHTKSPATRQSEGAPLSFCGGGLFVFLLSSFVFRLSSFFFRFSFFVFQFHPSCCSSRDRIS